MPSAGFELAIPAFRLLLVYAFHRAATGIGEHTITAINVSYLCGGGGGGGGSALGGTLKTL